MFLQMQAFCSVEAAMPSNTIKGTLLTMGDSKQNAHIHHLSVTFKFKTLCESIINPALQAFHNTCVFYLLSYCVTFLYSYNGICSVFLAYGCLLFNSSPEL